MSYAENTSVPVERSKAEIEGMLTKYGADQFVSGWKEREARIQFRAKDRFVRFTLHMPDPNDKAFTHDTRYTWKKRSAEAANKQYDQEVRRLWRALALVVKAKLEAVTSGITSFEEEFMSHIVMPDGKTVSEHALPMIAETYKTGKVAALLPGW